MDCVAVAGDEFEMTGSVCGAVVVICNGVVRVRDDVRTDGRNAAGGTGYIGDAIADPLIRCPILGRIGHRGR